MEFASPFVFYGAGFDPSGNPRNGTRAEYDLAKNAVPIYDNHECTPQSQTSNVRPTTTTPAFRIDTNVMKASMHVLEAKPDVQTGAAMSCLICQAVYGKTSAPLHGKNKWVCEYCGMENDTSDINSSPQVFAALQNANTADYMLGGSEISGVNSKPITLFCIDVSGSMCSSKKVDNDSDLYVSRLEAMQRTVVKQIALLKQKKQDSMVGLIAFHDHVDVIGDGMSPTIRIKGDMLYAYDIMIQAGEEFEIKNPIGKCHKELTDRTNKLLANGQTALGPALLVSIAMAGRVTGSQVIICTDGLSNVGVGALSPQSSELERLFASGMFQRASEYAVAKGVQVSVVSIRGEECNLADLGALAEKSGGLVHQVEPTQLDETIGIIAANTSIATNVEAQLILHTSLYPYKDGAPDGKPTGLVSQSQSAACVTSSTSLFFQFAPITHQKAMELPLKPSTPLHVPFQLQIRYSKNGQRRMRVMFAELPVTDDWSMAKRDLKLNLMTAHAAKLSAQIALGGDFTRARRLAEMYKLWFEQVVKTKVDERLYDNYGDTIAVLGGDAYNHRGVKHNHNNNNNDDNNDDDDDNHNDGNRVARNPTYLMVEPPNQSDRSASLQNNRASVSINDTTANQLFQMMRMGGGNSKTASMNSEVGMMNNSMAAIELTSYQQTADDSEFEAVPLGPRSQQPGYVVSKDSKYGLARAVDYADGTDGAPSQYVKEPIYQVTHPDDA